MVVGPQQHWLHLNQGTFREWWVEERLERKLRKEAALAAAVAAQANGNQQPSTPIRAMQKSGVGRSASKNGTSTPPNRGSVRTPLGEIDPDRPRDSNIGVQEDYLPAPTPGQPRKTQRLAADRHHTYGRSTNAVPTVEEECTVEEELQTEVVSMHITHGNESDEEHHLRMRSHRKASASVSPGRRDRSVSHQTTTTTTSTTIHQVIDDDASNDIENIGMAVAKAKSHDQVQRAASASGVLMKIRGGSSPKRAVAGTPRDAGVRKTSGRIGSVGQVSPTARKISGTH
jgi:cell division cycle 14